jgi:hypothetical protein
VPASDSRAGPARPSRAGASAAAHRLWTCLALALASSAPSLAHAHATRTSSIALDIHADSVDAEVDLAVDQLALALGRNWPGGVPPMAAESASLRDYLAEHMRLSSGDGARWRIDVRTLSLAAVDGSVYLRAQVRFVAPPGADRERLFFYDDAIVHRVVTHRTLVSLRRDFGQALLGDTPQLLGVLLFSSKHLTIHREHSSAWRGFRAVFGLGMQHIAEGTDHLLFLLLLLLIAPLSMRDGSWAGARSGRATVSAMLLVISAFTFGHSLSLAASALGWIEIPSRPIEVLVGGSIIVTAVHALRPFRAFAEERQPLMAAGFGLVHGFAFASALRGFGFEGKNLALALLGFNLGIETMQLAVVAMIVPWLFLLRTSRLYPPLRIATATCACLAATGWIAERLTGQPNPITLSIVRLASVGWVGLALLIAASLISVAHHHALEIARAGGR